MRKNYISPEYQYNNVYGTFNMKEESSFLCSKILNIEDDITIVNDNIVYYQESNGEQLDLSTENSLPQVIFDSTENKNQNHILTIDDYQTDYQRNENTRWILNINLSKILEDYLFATLKKWRTFEGIKNEMTINNNVNDAIRTYIKYNLIDKYQFEKVDLYIKYNKLTNLSELRFVNSFNNSIQVGDNLFTKYEIISSDKNSIDVGFNQISSSNEYNFNYYFNLFFKKL